MSEEVIWVEFCPEDAEFIYVYNVDGENRSYFDPVPQFGNPVMMWARTRIRYDEKEQFHKVTL